MCNSGPVLKDPLSKTLFDGDSSLNKVSRKIDPLGSYLTTGNKGNLDPINLKNAPDTITPPPPPQDEKQPDTMALRRRRRPSYAGTTLTGPAGVGIGSYNAGGTTLLGG